MYNPSIFEQDFAVLDMASVSNLTVLYWDKEGKKFADALSEAFCFNGSEGQQECELYVHHPIAPLSYEIIKVQFTNASTGKDLSVKSYSTGELNPSKPPQQ